MRWLGASVFALLLSLPTPARAADLLAGAAEVDVTPPPGYRQAGSYREVLAPGARDPIRAKALYLAQGDARAVLIVCDVCGMERQQARTIRERVEKETGVPAAFVSVSATHTHGGPMHYDPVFVPLFNAAARAAGRPVAHDLGDYPARFVDGCVKAAADAKAAARPAGLEVATATVPGLAFNRRYHMADGTVRMNPPKRSKDIVKAAGPTDPDLPLAVFTDPKTGAPFASLCSFAMHVTTYGGKEFSADYPGHLGAELRKAYGPRFISLFAEGCAGDCNQVNALSADPNPTPEQAAAKLAAAFRAAARGVAAPNLAAKSGKIEALLRDDRPADLAAARDTLVGEKSKRAAFLDQVEAYRVLLVNHMRTETGPRRPLDVQAFRLSADCAVVTLPHEVFVEIGLEIRKRSPFRHTLIVTIANEVDCYVPTRAAFAQRGSYEVTNSPYQPGVGEALAEEATRLLKELAP